MVGRISLKRPSANQICPLLRFLRRLPNRFNILIVYVSICPPHVPYHPLTATSSAVDFFPFQPPVTPLLYRTAWHVPLFPNDLVLKICLHEDDRKQVVPTLAALDPRVCYLIVAPRGSSNPTAASTSASASKRGVETLSSSNGWSLPTGRSARATPVSTPSPAAARAAAAAAAAVIANAKAVAAVAAAKEAKAKAAAAAAEEAVMVAKAVEAGVTVPWTWRESDLGSKLDRENPKAKIRLSLDSNLGRLSSDAPVPLASAGAWREAIPWRETDMEVEATGTDVYIWKGSQSSGETWTNTMRQFFGGGRGGIETAWKLEISFGMLPEVLMSNIFVCVVSCHVKESYLQVRVGPEKCEGPYLPGRF